MNRNYITVMAFVSWVLVSPIFAAQAVPIMPTPTGVTDIFTCQIRFWGNADGGGPVTMHPGPITHTAELLMDGSGPSLESQAELGSNRYLDGPVKDGWQSTMGSTNLSASLGDSEISAGLWLMYHHMYKTDAAGVPTEAYQSACLNGVLFKNNTLVATNQCPQVGNDPTQPNSGWEKVAIEKGVPVLSFNQTAFVETPAGSGVLKVFCAKSDGNIIIGGGPVSLRK